uniref:Uncharacterized protein n=1 Tax=Arundo donax TaxID=35708 RepID=A0A0A9F0B1_ARUDO
MGLSNLMVFQRAEMLFRCYHNCIPKSGVQGNTV